MKHKIVASVQWETESDLPALELEKQVLEEIQSRNPNSKIKIIRIDNLRSEKKREVLGEFSLNEVLDFVNAEDKKEYIVNGKKYLVRMNSQRYFVFKTNPNCAACGLQGSKFLLEQYPADRSPHFNLYAQEGDDLILMTKDHIQAKSIGGKDHHSNYQTMCAICNNLKGDSILTLDGVRELRQIYNDNKELPKKDLNEMLKTAKERLSLKRPIAWDRKNESNTLIAKCDIVICKSNNQLIGRSVYSKYAHVEENIACIRKGTKIVPTVIDGRVLYVPFNNVYYQVNQSLVEFHQ